MARRGREECPQLQQLLTGWDGRFSPLIRKRVARHLDRCETCTATRARFVSPAALLTRIPIVPAPLALREQVLGQLDLVGDVAPAAAGRPVQPSRRLPRRRGGRDGFPPPMFPRRPRWRVGVAAAAILLLLAAGGWNTLDWNTLDWNTLDWNALDWNRSEAPVDAAGPEPPPPPLPSRPLASSAGPSPSEGSASSPPATPPPGQPPAEPPATEPPATEPPGTSPTGPPNLPGPTIHQLTADPAAIWEEDPAVCQQRPFTTTVSVRVSAAVDLSMVTLHWTVAGQPGETPMSRVDDRYRATVGPLATDTLQAGDTAPVTLRVEAIDAGSRAADRQAPADTLTLHDCTFQ